MPGEWNEGLIAEGGILLNEEIAHYGQPAAERVAAARGPVACALSHLAIIRARGPEAAAFLQGQLSNDIKALGHGSQLSGYCTAQGRLLAIFRILADGDDYLLVLPRALAASLLKRLKMYVLRAKVTLTEDIGWSILGVSGDPPVLPGSLPLPDSGAVAAADGLLLARIPAAAGMRCWILGPSERIGRLWAAVPPEQKIGAKAWRWLDIRAGIPEIVPATSEEFVPQMVNLDILGGISFQKGCYPGQEIVARMHYLGRLKQRMYAASLAAPAAPAPGSALQATNLPGQPAGHVVAAEMGPDDKVALLVVVQISSHEDAVVSYQGIPLQFTHLPYPLAASS
ncbi:MAG: folate-binding protein [Gammaproteobacteria bacterium]|nr:folate-binding protein [Gammaproteobacteria bacterium]